MSLPDEDLQYLQEKKYDYHIFPHGKETLVVIKQYPLPAGYSQSNVDLLVKIPPMYPMTPMDMFWVSPEIMLTGTGAYPDRADVFESFIGSQWQRFSRHYAWRSGIDSLGSHLVTVQKSLVNLA